MRRKSKTPLTNLLEGPSAKEPYDYDTLPLRLYFRIVETKNFALIARGCVGVDVPRLWEDIVRRSERDTNSIVYLKRVEDLKALRDIIAEYIIVKASLIRLLYKPNRNIIADLHERGYSINLATSEDYAISVSNNLQTVNNLITQLEMKSHELAVDEVDLGTANFDSAMAGVSVALGFAVPDNITLRRFNEYQKLIRRKNAKQEQHGD